MSNVKQVQNSSTIVVKQVAARIGADISGIKLSEDLDANTVKSIREAILKHKVVFFRNQDHLDDKGQEAFAGLLGKPVVHPTVPVKNGSNYILELNSDHGGGRANSWHTDVTFEAAYPKFSILRGVVIPEVGGDTVWANTTTAYENLPAELRNLADQLWALHTNDYDYAAKRSNVSSETNSHYKDVFTSTLYETEHPVVHVHPETGERHLLLGHFVKKFVGLSSLDSAQLFSVLQEHVTQIENTVRWRWSAGDVVIWDNRATQHYAVNDYDDAQRVVRRITIDGEEPISLDGRRSITRTKVKNN
ncbi:TauD/TfdA dioxygenase family protein [Peribacillus simplex]|uniref:Alpha-ketoglutarate-dependent sulfate ester dioxygenase n=1 Tax=Peribacillus simplex NBRC 15720 = DSM 1321 TaxID=1349754 RepID=A0A223ELU5_9BACI|nr:TauD/TfdA family dioxygenase [Peribacillus simplex]ASS96065.1 taurine dioxygenase [Peribacillus simplex NBRC 15720 = DSM 1321]MEC1397161.1 TauD/TfdA family dioxygenase [Peribacillus simplex]